MLGLEKKRQLNLLPLADRLIVRPMEVPTDQKTPGGIYIPAIAQEKTQQGEVLAVGPGRVTDDGVTLPMALSVGDVIVYGKFAGSQLTVNDEDVLVIRESDVIARVS